MTDTPPPNPAPPDPRDVDAPPTVEAAPTSVDTVPALAQRRSLWQDLPVYSGAAFALLALVACTVGYELITTGQSNFIKPVNLINILKQNAEVGVIAVGMTLVIILGGIDLSVGSLMALAGGVGILVMAQVQGSTDHEALALMLGLITMITLGAAAGALNGILVAYGRIASFIATLGGLVAFRSLSRWAAEGGQFRVEGGNTWFAELGRGISIPFINVATRPGQFVPLELPYALILFVLVALIGALLLNRTRLGRYIIAIGSNERAAIYSAIPVAKVKLITFTLIGTTAGLAAMAHASRYESVNSAQAGQLLELEVIAAVVLGGTSMRGGVGSITGTVLGVLIIGVIKNMMPMLGIPSRLDGLVMGVIIIAAVLIHRLSRREG